MSESSTHDRVRAKWVGPDDGSQWAQHRDEDGIVHNLPARDLTDDDWSVLSPGARSAVRESPLYEAGTDAEHKRSSGRAAPAAAVKE